MSNFVECRTIAQVDAVLASCWAEGFKAVATNLGECWVVEYWLPAHNGHVVAWRKQAMRKAVAGAGVALSKMHRLA